MPPCSTARRALAHVFELGGNLLQSAIRRCCLDAGDQPDQPVIALLARRAVQQCRLDDALGHQSPHGAAQPFHRPGGLGRYGSGRGRHRPRAGRAASAARSATTCPTGPGHWRGVRRRGWRGPCGWRPGRRRAGRGCRRHVRGCVPPAARPWCARQSAPVRAGRRRPAPAVRTCPVAWWCRSGRAGCGNARRQPRAAR